MGERNYFILLIAIIVGVCLFEVAQQTRQYQAPSFESLEAFSAPKLWGRKSFVPDWRRGELTDIQASQHFLAHWAPRLADVPRIDSIANSPTVAESVSVIPVPHWLEVLPPQDKIQLSKYRDKTEKFSALGESEPFAFAVRSTADETRLSATLTDWRIEGKPSEPIAHSIRLMLPYRARTNAGKRDTSMQIKPMVLLASRDNTWTFPSNYTMVLVADIHVGIATTPGRYTAKFALTSGGEILHRTPITLEVLPFELRVNDFHAGAFGTTYDIWEGGFTGYYPAMIDSDSRYGFNIAGGFFNKGNEIPFSRDPTGKLIVSRSHPKFKKFDRTMQRLRQHGMGDVVFWNWGGSGKYRQFLNVLKGAGIDAPFESPAGKSEFAGLLHAIKEMEVSRNWPEIVINPYDEALKDQHATREIIASIPYVNAISPSTRLYMTEWRSGYARHYQSSGKQLVGEGRPRLREYRNLRRSGEAPRANFEVIGSNILDAKGRALQDKLGGEYWNYTGAWSISPSTQFGLGFRAWATRSETVLIWANYKGSLTNRGWTVHHPLPIDPNGRKNRDTRGPVLAGAQSYAVREGIDDRKYIETLRYHAWRAGSDEDWRYLQTLSKQARHMLKNPLTIGGIDNVPGILSDDASLTGLRTEIKDRILKLLARPSIH